MISFFARICLFQFVYNEHIFLLSQLNKQIKKSTTGSPRPRLHIFACIPSMPSVKALRHQPSRMEEAHVASSHPSLGGPPAPPSEGPSPAGLPHPALCPASHPRRDGGSDTGQRQQQICCHVSSLEGVLLPLCWQRFHVILTALTLSGRFSFLSPSPCVPPLLPPLLCLGCDCLSPASELSGACLLFLYLVKPGDTGGREYSAALGPLTTCLSPCLGWGPVASQKQLGSISGGTIVRTPVASSVI